MLIVKKLSNFNKIANKVTLDDLMTDIYVEGNYAIELFEDEKIIHLNIPHGNIYSKCNAAEWKMILNYLKELGLGIPGTGIPGTRT